MRSAFTVLITVLLFCSATLAQLPRTVATQNGVLIEFQRISGSGSSPWQRVEQVRWPNRGTSVSVRL